MNSQTTPHAARDQLDEHKVGDYASHGILSCRPDAPLDEIAGLMVRNSVHAIVVVDDRTAEPPVISDLDLIAALTSGHYGELSAADIAGTHAVSVFEDEGLGRAAQLLSDNRVSHLVVRNERRQPVGIVSTLDLAAAISGARLGNR